ncbi:MAG TPA: hypothetical protein VEH04_03605 [Verrucomicrobiae bacterium]|nr:hypothetical protein [Verrucomicrobiae bacterium]
MAEREYIKLTGNRQKNGFALITASRSRLWLGRDHLLLVTTDGFTESYKRFYLRDIQAITIRKTQRIAILGVITGAFVVLFGVIAFTASEPVARWVFGILAGICAIPFAVNLLLGETCACQLRTAVQTEDLHSVSRVARATRLLERLRPLIAEAQGSMAGEEILERLALSAQAPRAVAPSRSPQSAGAEPAAAPGQDQTP